MTKLKKPEVISLRIEKQSIQDLEYISKKLNPFSHNMQAVYRMAVDEFIAKYKPIADKQ